MMKIRIIATPQKPKPQVVFNKFLGRNKVVYPRQLEVKQVG